MGCECVKHEMKVRKLGRGEEKEVKRKEKDHKKMHNDTLQSPQHQDCLKYCLC